MRCAKCGHENPESNDFCGRCHAPARFTCPACRHTQNHGGHCDNCGLDFVKYAMMLVFQNQTSAQQERERQKRRSDAIMQILLLPVTGGWSLLKFLRNSLNRS